MKRGWVVALLCIGLVQAGTVFAQDTRNPSRPLALTNITVVDIRREVVVPNRTVLIGGNRITELGKTGEVRIPNDAQVVDASGKFLIPGLWDMHVHTGAKEVYMPLYIANGVTGVRDMGGDGGDLPDPTGNLSTRFVLLSLWREEINSGALLGPRMVLGGIMIDGPNPMWRGAITVSDAVNGRLAVDVLRRMGVDFIKVYSMIPRDAYLSIAAESKKQLIPFAGHLPFSVRAAEASDLGQKTIEHMTNIVAACSTSEDQFRNMAMGAPNRAALVSTIPARAKLILDTYDQTIAKTLFARFARNQTWQVPTLAIQRALAMHDIPSVIQLPELRYVPLGIRSNWERYPFPEGDILVFMKRIFAKNLELLGEMHRAGVPILAGSDSGNPYDVPGFALHQELALLVSAGFTPPEALKAATLEPARFFDKEAEMGTVEKGKLADLVLLDANPLADIHNTQKIFAVLVNGRFLDRSALDGLLAQAEAAASKN